MRSKRVAFCILIVSVSSLALGVNLKGQKVHPGLDVETSPKLSPLLARVSPLLPPPEYAQWWVEIANCEGLKVPEQVDQVKWYEVNADHFLTPGLPSGMVTVAVT